MKLILASKSPRRRELLKILGFPFTVQPSGVAENSKETRPHRLVQELAKRKAESVAKKMKSGIVLGADTIVVLGKDILGQPKDSKHAYRMLYRLSGTTHKVFTGVAVVDVEKGWTKTAFARSHVRMKKLPIDEILRLAQLNLDKAGSYAIQDKNDPIAKVVKGDYDNVVGLPLKVVRKLLAPYRRLSTRAKR